MTTSSSNLLASVEAAYQGLGQLLHLLNGNGAAPVAPSGVKQRKITHPGRKVPCRNYIKYPSPPGLRARAATAFRVADLCKAYNFPTGLAGGGTIGILELSTPGSKRIACGYTQADLDMFSQLNGLPQILPKDVSVNGGQNQPGGDGDGEVLLDIEVAAAVYFYCTGQLPTIKMYFAPNDDASFAAVMKAAVDDECDVLSISWGADEASWGESMANQTEAAARAATEDGHCVIFAASGDNSSSDGDVGANVDLPSACPHIIGCGGTTKFQFKEIVWGDGTPNGRGTGGGYSTFFPEQSWQIGATPSPGQPGRMVPDVAADADPDTGYLVVVGGHETQIGGTSAVAPLYAGLFAALGRKLGFVTPTLWQHPEAFVDITEGSNGSFNAAKGPDPCTGLGVPNGIALASLFTGMSQKKRRFQTAGSA
jgi:kumamolisin